MELEVSNYAKVDWGELKKNIKMLNKWANDYYSTLSLKHEKYKYHFCLKHKHEWNKVWSREALKLKWLSKLFWEETVQTRK